jgi:putative transposase
MAHSYTNLLYHLVFSTKEREPWLDDAIRPTLFKLLGGILKEEGGTPFIINGVADAWVHRTCPGLEVFSWQAGYGAFTVSQSKVETVRTYIENQEEHHRRIPFQDELRALLRKHGQEVDESLLWQ